MSMRLILITTIIIVTIISDIIFPPGTLEKVSDDNDVEFEMHCDNSTKTCMEIEDYYMETDDLYMMISDMFSLLENYDTKIKDVSTITIAKIEIQSRTIRYLKMEIIDLNLKIEDHIKTIVDLLKANHYHLIRIMDLSSKGKMKPKYKVVNITKMMKGFVIYMKLIEKRQTDLKKRFEYYGIPHIKYTNVSNNDSNQKSSITLPKVSI